MIPLHLLLLIFAFTIFPIFVTSSSSGSSGGASWQPPASDSQSIQEANEFAEQPPIVFSPTGRLHPVEVTVEAAKSNTNPRSNLVLAMNCKDGIVMISNVPISPYLNTTTTNSTTAKSLFLDTEQNSIFHQLSSCLVAATAGNLVDGHVLQHLLHQCCHSIMIERQSGKHTNDDVIKANQLARRVADQLQLPTQNMFHKHDMLASFAVLAGPGELWRLDPTGQFWKCQAAVIGGNANKAEDLLLKRLSQQDGDDVCQRIQEMSTEDALTLLTECLESSFATKLPTGGGTFSQKIYWHSMIQYHGSKESSQSLSAPRRIFQRGAFVPHHAPKEQTKAEEAS